jgi:hypothetical protein
LQNKSAEICREFDLCQSLHGVAGVIALLGEASLDIAGLLITPVEAPCQVAILCIFLCKTLYFFFAENISLFTR